MTNIKITLVPNENRKVVNISLVDLDTTEQDWEAMPEEDKRELIDAYISGFDQPYWDIDKISEEK